MESYASRVQEAQRRADEAYSKARPDSLEDVVALVGLAVVNALLALADRMDRLGDIERDRLL